jgi:Holliday junction resolvasome RuvABC endonuclease subunit
MMYAGIDYSMTSPGITVGSTSDFHKCKTFFYTNKKKFEGKFGKNVYGVMAHPYTTQMERFDNLTEWTISILKKFKVTEVCLEGYAYAGSGVVFNIAENTGIMKHSLWKSDIIIHTVAPTQVKKFFSGKGNANKEAMHDAFVEKTGISLAALLDAKAKDSPVSDAVDSYAMLQYGIDTYF